MSLTTEKMKAYVADIQAKLFAMGRPVIAEMFPAPIHHELPERGL